MTILDSILITGGSSGIGAGLASVFHARGAHVIVAGRNREHIEAFAARYPGMHAEVVDVADPHQVAALVDRVKQRWPDLNTVVNNAGIQTLFDFTQPDALDPAALGTEIDVNLKGLIYVANAFLPLLKQQPSARLINVGSGLCYIPLAAAPVYSATKAAVHSFTISLRRQLRGATVQIIEIIPSVVETNLHRNQLRKPPGAMTLATFITAAMAGLDAGQDEIVVGRAQILRIASRIAPKLFLNIINKPCE